ncbi:hypothetical protein EJB05_09940, partial [Eragrostis curvula]
MLFFGLERRPYSALSALSAGNEHACPRSMVGWACVTLDSKALACLRSFSTVPMTQEILPGHIVIR